MAGFYKYPKIPCLSERFEMKSSLSRCYFINTSLQEKLQFNVEIIPRMNSTVKKIIPGYSKQKTLSQVKGFPWKKF